VSAEGFCEVELPADPYAEAEAEAEAEGVSKFLQTQTVLVVPVRYF